MNILYEIFNDHYEEMFFLLHPRDSVIENITKKLNCGDTSCDGAIYACEKCCNYKFISFRYHSRFCPTCENMYSIGYTSAMSFMLIYCNHRHCVFTIFEGLYHFFLEDCSLLNWLFSSVQSVVLCMFHKENNFESFSPSLISILQIFGS